MDSLEELAPSVPIQDETKMDDEVIEFKTPPADEVETEDVCRDSLGCEPEVTSGSPPPFNAYVVERLVQYVRKIDLLNCRFVCRLWNDEIVRLLTKTPDWDSSAEWDDLVLYKGLCPDLNKLANPTTGESTLREFHLLLERSAHPELLINVLEISHDIVPKFNTCPIHILECEQILRKYGKHVKRMRIADDGELGVLSRCLGQYGYCPNLEHLKFIPREGGKESPTDSEKFPYFEQPFVQNIDTLKLKTLELSYCTSFANFTNAFGGILGNSLGIEYLKIRSFPESTKDELQSSIQVLRSKPEATKNLKALKVSGNFLDSLEPLGGILFGSNLKTIELYDFLNNGAKSTKEEQTAALAKFLAVLPLESMESFKLKLNQNGIVVQPRQKVMAYHGIYEPLVFQVVKSLPSLSFLSIGMVSFGGGGAHGFGYRLLTMKELLENCGSLNKSPRLVHKQMGFINQENMDKRFEFEETFGNLCKAFPNLWRLEIEPKPPTVSSLEESQRWFDRSFYSLSQMKLLKQLVIHLDSWESTNSSVDFYKPFRLLREIPNLWAIKLLGLKEDEFKMKLVATALPAFFGQEETELREILFDCCLDGMKDMELKKNLLKLIADFADRNVDLKVKGCTREVYSWPFLS